MKYFTKTILFLFCLIFEINHAQVLITPSGSITENFNSLASAGTNTWTDNSTIPNWLSQRTGTGTTYVASTGNSNAGGLYSFGSTVTPTDRALGSLGSSNPAAGAFAHGILLQNTLGVPVTSLAINYTGEQWRMGGPTSSLQTISFWYKISPTPLTALTPSNNTGWTAVTALDFSSPQTNTTAAALDGNLPANRVVISPVTIPSFSLSNNDYVLLKWEDPDHLASDHGLSIDDVTIKWILPPPTVTGITNLNVCVGSQIQIAGTNFNGVSTLSVGNVPVSSFTVNSLTQITAIVGAPASGSVTVITSGGSATSSAVLNVLASPSITATSSNSFICQGSTAILTASGALTYSWNTGATTASIAVSPSVTTNYIVTGANVAGCTDTKIVSLNVYTNPTVIVSSNSSSLCTGSTATLTASGAASYSWNTGSTNTVISVSPSTTVVYTVTGSNSGCTDTKTISLNVIQGPTLTAVSTSSAICSGATSTLAVSGASTYLWNTGSTNTVISVSPSVTTNYTVSGTDASGCSDTKTIALTVNPNPTVNISATTSFVCIGSTATLTASGANTYSWSTGATNTLITVSPTVTTSYQLFGTDALGCTDTKSITLAINSNPTVSAVASASAICAGSTATLVASGATNYTWTSIGSTSLVTVTPIASTIYSVTGQTNGCSNTATIALTTIPNPTVLATASQSVLCDNGSTGSSILTASTNATSYSWSNGANTTTTSVTPTLTTNYTVTVTQSGCSSNAIVTVSVTNCTGVNENTNTYIGIYPNPLNEALTVYGLGKEVTLELYDVAGKLIVTEKVNGTTTINTTFLEKGVYILNITDNGTLIKASKLLKN